MLKKSYGSCQEILTWKLGMHYVVEKFVPHLLPVDHKLCCIEVCSELRKIPENHPNSISKVTTSHESWFYDCDPETKQQSSQWKNP